MSRLTEVPVDGESDKCRTFIFNDEGHTLGNALRFIITQYPDVSFCGYTIPHPAEAKMNFRIQSTNRRAVDILRQGLEDLQKMCDYTIETFNIAYEKHISSQNVPMDTT